MKIDCSKCKHVTGMSRDDGFVNLFTCKYRDCGHENTDNCPMFEGQNGLRPRFCELASSIEIMARQLVFPTPCTDGKVHYEVELATPLGCYRLYDTKAEAIAVAKEWLMEEVDK